MDARFCFQHPDRPATGVCVRCRRPACPECTTKIEGVNHCTGCLSKRAVALAGPPPPPGAAWKLPLGVLAAALAYWLLFLGLGYGILAS